MGQFSWITQDTNKSISSTNPRPVTMQDNKGNKWTELDYEGYGVFNGKDFYQLLAEMNNMEGLTGNLEHDRCLGIDLYFSEKPFISPNLNNNPNIEWINRTPLDCPNQGWV